MSFAESFGDRHIGPRSADIPMMLRSIGVESLEELVEQVTPASIRSTRPLSTEVLGDGESETDLVAELKAIANRNEVFRSYIGLGYSDCVTPPVILRNVLEDPRWYTPYTPYQSEVSQGRLEALLNFQTMVMDLTGMEIANASLLDEATAVAEAVTLCLAVHHGRRKAGDEDAVFISSGCHPQTIAVVETRARAVGIPVILGDEQTFNFDRPVFALVLQYPDTVGVVRDYAGLIDRAHGAGALVVVAADLLSLTLLKPPGEWGADVVAGSSQRFGVPMGYGGPHAAFLATRETFKRQIPGRIVGVSRDTDGKPAVRLALQTREQHIRREKATSNICTAQVLLAVVASMYAVYHGPDGLKEIARRVHSRTQVLEAGLHKLGYAAQTEPFFDTLRISLGPTSLAAALERARSRRINFRVLDPGTVTVSLDETTTIQDVSDLLEVFAPKGVEPGMIDDLTAPATPSFPKQLERTSSFLTHPIFNTIRSETEMLRYMNELASKDISLANSMIPLGSCTMKLNATAEMIPVTWPEFARMHPFAPIDQAQGYQELFRRLEAMLAEITGFAAVSLQPNAGSQGEYAGLLVISRYHRDGGEGQRNVCLIPSSAHGTNPASAAMAGMRVVVVKCDEAGNIDVEDLRERAREHRAKLSALMVTYPSTHGVFEAHIRKICDIVHQYGGQVYLDGANMNAQVGICRPGEYGADVCHLNLHKTFCIPHGGGGPGMGPIGVAAHLVQFLPSHPVVAMGGEQAIGPISAAPWGSPSILPIPYAYIRLMGASGLRRASEVAILIANYIAHRIENAFPILYRGSNGFVAHECIADPRAFKRLGIEVEDIAKRLIDYGFHAPTVSFPVPGTMMIEPTESESKEELDRFCDALISIREEIAAIENGKADRTNNLLKRAPHTAEQIASDEWDRPYSRMQAAYPAPWSRKWKYWPPVARVDNVYGERNVVCSCLPIGEYA